MEREEPKPVVADSAYQVLTYQGGALSVRFLNMVRAKWLRQLRQGNDYFALIDSKSYFSAYSKYVNQVLRSEGITIKIATLTDQDTALGFSVSRGSTLHFVFVFPDARKQGIARSLVPEKIDVITHLTKTALKLWSTKLPGAIFDPFQ